VGGKRFVVTLAKEDFKFSCAHFTVFGRCEAETLHGHNYQVRVELEGSELDELGLLVDFDRVKKVVRELCDGLDSRMLVPVECDLLSVEAEGETVRVAYAQRRYAFPAADVLLLPLANTTVELLACYLWDQLAPSLADTGVDTLAVDVAETAGQSCLVRAACC
jgi:6-pyruvoyltetrahydropterin/6-carboxytetrahydropterin synthase